LEEFNFPTLFYGHPQSLTIFLKLSYQQIAPWELLHKSKDFSINISKLFFKATKVSIQKVIGSRWVCIRKLNGRSLKASKVRNKSNLDKIFKSYLEYRDLERATYFIRLFKKFTKKIIYYDKTN
jgi:hypothetical protein